MMNRIWRSVSNKIAIMVIVVEVIALSIAGVFYVTSFNDAVDQRNEERALLPARLLDSGLVNTIINPDVLRQLVGEEVQTFFIANPDGRILFTIDPALRGQNIADFPQLSTFDFEQDLSAPYVETVNEGDSNFIYVVARSSSDLGGVTQDFTSYVQIDTSQAEQEKRDFLILILLGSVATVLLTTGLIYSILRTTLLRRISEILSVVVKIEGGDLKARVKGKVLIDEIGVLHGGVNTMAERLENLVDNLEHRVQERTVELEDATVCC